MRDTCRGWLGSLLLFTSMSVTAAAPALGEKQKVLWEHLQARVGNIEQQHTQLRRKMMDLKAAADGRENISTPREMMQLLEQLYRGKLIGQPLLEDFFTVLATPKDSWLPRNLPEDLRIANKPGALEGVRNDSGIVFVKNRPYVICVMTTYLASERGRGRHYRNLGSRL